MPAEGPPGAGGEPERFEPGALAGLPAELALARLPPGRHGLPRAFVADQQRLRIVAAMLRVLPEHGYPDTTIAHITGEAAVSRSAFYQQFADKEECFLVTYDLATEWFCERVERAVAGAASWPDRARAGVGEAVGLLTANPAVAHLFAVESLQAGPAARQRQEAFLGRFAAALREEAPARPEVSPELEELLLGGAVSLIARYVDSGRGEEIEAAVGTLVESLLVPYLDPGSPERGNRQRLSPTPNVGDVGRW
jgi:AcrR family transcriptional regulator